MSETGGNGHEHKVAVQIINLDSNNLLEAIHHYVLKKYGKGRIVDFKWILTPERGHVVPPIQDIAMECTLE